MVSKMNKVTAGLCGIAVMAGTFAVNIPVASANVLVTQGVENVVKDSNQQQIIDVFNGINAFRASKGLAPVKFSVPISSISQGWSDKMASTDTFYHNPNYVAGAPSNWQAASEIIAARWDRSGQGLVDQWIGSPGHNAIMSDPQYNTMGIGVAFTDLSTPEDPSATRYGTYGTANLFRYADIPTGTYNSPADYFAGKPPLNGLKSVTPASPVWGSTEYTLPNVEGVKYTVNGVETNPGTYRVTVKNYDVRVSPKAGYTFPPNTVLQYLYNYSEVPAYVVVPESPTFDDDAYMYAIPYSEGVEYLVNDVVKAAGTYKADPTKPYVMVKARALSGYTLDTTQSSVWAFTFHSVTKAVTPVAPTFQADLGKYTIPTSEGITYKVNGTAKAAGTYSATGAITVTAEAQSGYSITSGATSTWSATLTAPLVSVTPVAPKQNVMLKTLTIPSQTGVKYTVNGVAKAAGTYWGLGTMNIKAEATAGYKLAGTTSWTFVYQDTPLVKAGDLLALDSAGNVWNYKDKATTGRTLLVSGWGAAKKLNVVDWNSDGIQDIVTQWKSGILSVHYGKANGSFSTSNTLAATGWADTEFSVGKYINGNKYPNIIAKDTSGNLWGYGNPTGSSLGQPSLMASGWQALQPHLIDWDKDGNMDILAKNTATGQVILYRTDGAGNFKVEARKVVASNWGDKTLTATRDYYGAGTQGFFVLDADGKLYYYKTGDGVWISKVLEGSGWGSMNLSKQ
jgi:uncharacterized protein YkwD